MVDNKFTRRPTRSHESINSVGRRNPGFMEMPPIAMIPPMLFMDPMFPTGLDRVDGKSGESDRMSAIKKIMNQLEMNNSHDLYTVNYKQTIMFTMLVGDPHVTGNYEDQNNLNVLSMLRISLSYSVNLSKPNMPMVYGLTQEDGLWYDAIDSDIKCVGHDTGEPLVCPNCGTYFYSMSDVLMAPYAGGVPINFEIEADKKKKKKDKDKTVEDMKVFHPVLILTPICSKCYCDTVMGAISAHEDVDESINNINVSPVFCVPSKVKGMYPLYPECIYKKLKTPQNRLHIFGSYVFWPNQREDILCDAIIQIMKESQNINLDEEDPNDPEE